MYYVPEIPTDGVQKQYSNRPEFELPDMEIEPESGGSRGLPRGVRVTQTGKQISSTLLAMQAASAAEEQEEDESDEESESDSEDGSEPPDEVAMLQAAQLGGGSKFHELFLGALQFAQAHYLL